MARSSAPWIACSVSAVPPGLGSPLLFADQAADEWDIEYQASGANITLPADATPAGSAKLWGLDSASTLWTILEYTFQAIDRTVVDGKAARDKIPRASGGIAALHVEYPAFVSAGAPVFLARTVRIVSR